jgi:hypothetical protein
MKNITAKQNASLDMASRQLPEGYDYAMHGDYGVSLLLRLQEVGYVSKKSANFQKDANKAEEARRVQLLSRARRAMWHKALTLEEFQLK